MESKTKVDTTNINLQRALEEVRDLFITYSPYTAGPDAGKVDEDGLDQVFKHVKRFNLDPDKSSYQYFDMLDRDGDGLISFQEFLGPLLAVLPPEVGMAFTADIRFKIESLNQIRIAYKYCSKLSYAVTPDLVRTTLSQKDDQLSLWHLKEFENLQLEERVYTAEEWHSQFCQAEKFLFDTFSQILFQQQDEQWINPHETMCTRIQAMLDSGMLEMTRLPDPKEQFEVASAKLAKGQQILRDALKVFTPKPLAEIYVPAADSKTWDRYRSTIGTFQDIVTNQMATLQTRDSLLLENKLLKEEIKKKDLIIEENEDFKDRYNQLKEEAGGPYTLSVRGRDVEIQKQKTMRDQYRVDLDRLKKIVEVYDNYMAGVHTKQECDTFVSKIRVDMDPFKGKNVTAVERSLTDRIQSAFLENPAIRELKVKYGAMENMQDAKIKVNQESLPPMTSDDEICRNLLQEVLDAHMSYEAPDEPEEKEDEIAEALGRNTALQIQSEVDSKIDEILQTDRERLAREEAARVAAYTQQWQTHIEALLNQKNEEWSNKLDTERNVFRLQMDERDLEVEEQKAVAKKATVAAGVANLAQKQAEESRDLAEEREKYEKEKIRQSQLQITSLSEEIEALKQALGTDAVDAIKFYKEREQDLAAREARMEEMRKKDEEEWARRRDIEQKQAQADKSRVQKEQDSVLAAEAEARETIINRPSISGTADQSTSDPDNPMKGYGLKEKLLAAMKKEAAERTKKSANELEHQEKDQKIFELKQQLEVERSQRKQELHAFDEKIKQFEKTKKEFETDKERLEEIAERLNASSYGQERLIEKEVARRVNISLQAFYKANPKGDKDDDDSLALREFMEFKQNFEINYKRISDMDVLVDSLEVADSLDSKKLLMRYKRLKEKSLEIDKYYVARLTKNYFSCIRKAGLLMKKHEKSWTNKWEYRYIILTNAGFIFFQSKTLQTEEDLRPKNFKPLNDFVLQDVEPREVEGRNHVFRVVFHKDLLLKNDLTLQAPTQKDKDEWVRALRLHQIDLFRSRTYIMEQWLERQGIDVPRTAISIRNVQFLEDVLDNNNGMEQQEEGML